MDVSAIAGRLLSWEGRIGRAEYLAVGGSLLALQMLVFALSESVSGAFLLLVPVVGWCFFMQVVKRGHDFGAPGILSVGGIFLTSFVVPAIWAVIPGASRPNAYGDQTEDDWAAGWAATPRSAGVDTGPSRDAQLQTALEHRAMVGMLVKIGQVDGPLNDRERESIRSILLKATAQALEERGPVLDLVREIENDSTDFEVFVHLFVDVCDSVTGQGLRNVHDLLISVAYSDGDFNDTEMEALRHAAGVFGLADRTLEDEDAPEPERPAEARRDPLAEHWATLGLEPGADAAAVKAAYRRLSKEYHPDFTRTQGAKLQALAEEEMKRINAAYKALSELA